MGDKKKVIWRRAPRIRLVEGGEKASLKQLARHVKKGD